MKLTLDVNPSKSLDTEIMIKNVIIETSVVVKDAQSLVISSLKKYKRDAILGDLLKAHGTSSNFELENQCIKKKYLSINFA